MSQKRYKPEEIIHKLRVAKAVREWLSNVGVRTLYIEPGSPGEVYVPVELSAGEEAQVDFGYMGRFKDERGKWVKVWVFACVLSNSRYAYYELVTDQRVETFIKCHENAFRFFGGVPQVVRIDNLKAGVLEVNFYEPIYQHDYHHFPDFEKKG